MKKSQKSYLSAYIFSASSIFILLSIFLLPPFAQAGTSVYFRNDTTAQNILAGSMTYQMSNTSYYNPYPNWSINTLSFDYKIMNALKGIGYPLNYVKNVTYAATDTPASIVLHRFEAKHNLPISNVINKTLMQAIDQAVATQEGSDTLIAQQYLPYSKFIQTPTNQPSSAHLASLYSNLFNSLPVATRALAKAPAPLTIDDFRTTLAFGLSANLGKMLDPTDNHVLSIQELISAVNNKSDYKFCPDAYYAELSTASNGDCIHPSTQVDTGAGQLDDISYMVVTFIHEYGHEIGSNFVNGTTKGMDYFFGQISFDMSGTSTWKSSTLLRTSNNDGEFISGYAKAYNVEDFAESFTAYINEGNIFRLRARSNQYLQQKYDFLKDRVFGGLEYATGDVASYNLWISNNNPLPFHPSEYDVNNINWVWDYKYPVLINATQQTVTPSVSTINSGDNVKLTFTFPANTVRASLYLACPSGVTGAGNLCNQFINITGNYDYTVILYNNSSGVQNVVPNYYVYLSTNPNYAVGVSSQISVKQASTPTPTPIQPPTPQPSLTVLSPNGGETWAVGSTHAVNWSSNAGNIVSPNVGLYLTDSLGHNAIQIASTVLPNGTYNWTIPSNIGVGGYKISAYLSWTGPGAGGAIHDDSDAPFTIVNFSSVQNNPPPVITTTTVAPSITSLSPNSGPAGTVVTITGANFGTSNSVVLNGIVPVTSSSQTKLTFTVPLNTPVGAHGISVINNANNYGSNTLMFTVTTSPVTTTIPRFSIFNLTASVENAIRALFH